MPFSRALIHSLIEAPLLIGDLPEASAFPRHHFACPETPPSLNFEQKLGHLYEDALAVLLQSTPVYELLARNLQLRNTAGTTLGELDFLLRDLLNDQLIHLELATKFYLAIETDSILTLPGPDPRDNYFQKLERLRDHQLTLVGKHQSLLPSEYREKPIVTQQLIYGCLFDHIHACRPAKPELLNPQARRGRWLSINEYPDHFANDAHCEIIPKFLWPVPIELFSDIPLQAWKPATHLERCLMLRVNDGPLPYFVTPSTFPKPSSPP